MTGKHHIAVKIYLILGGRGIIFFKTVVMYLAISTESGFTGSSRCKCDLLYGGNSSFCYNFSFF